MRTSPPLNVECLEDRYAPARFGVPWPDPGHLTLSFAPDGTQVANQRSELFQALDAQIPAKVWQRELLRAFQTWAINANINVSVVDDGGQPFGTSGSLQGDTRFGDIRIAAIPMPRDVVAVATPFDVTAGTWSGDVRLNSSYVFGLRPASSGRYDLYTVALHEAGHVFGLGHSQDPASAMYESFVHPRTGLTPGDVEALQGLYGLRKADVDANSTLATATMVALGQTADADISTHNDADVYQFQTGSDGGGFTVRLQTSLTSLLVPRVTVYDSALQVINSVVGMEPGNGDVVIDVPSALPNTTYYAKVESGVDDVFGIGGYRFRVEPILAGTPPSLPVSTPETNQSFATADSFEQETDRPDGLRDYATGGSLGSSASEDFYHLRAPTLADGGTSVMTVMAWSLASDLDPRVTVYDQNDQPVNAEVLVNDTGTYVIQIPNAPSDSLYYVALRASQPEESTNAGSYFLAVHFGWDAITLPVLAEGTLENSTSQDFQTFQIAESQLFHFVLSADTLDGLVPAAVRVTAYDQKGNILSSIVTPDGEPVSRNVFLAPGTYTFGFAAATSGQPFSPLAYRLRGISLSDPIGPEAEDTTLDPVSFLRAPRQQNPPYSFGATVNHSFLTFQEPFSDPHWNTGLPTNAHPSLLTVTVFGAPASSSAADAAGPAPPSAATVSHTFQDPFTDPTQLPTNRHPSLPTVSVFTGPAPSSAASAAGPAPSPASPTLVASRSSVGLTATASVSPGSPPALGLTLVAGENGAGSMNLLSSGNERDGPECNEVDAQAMGGFFIPPRVRDYLFAQSDWGQALHLSLPQGNPYASESLPEEQPTSPEERAAPAVDGSPVGRLARYAPWSVGTLVLLVLLSGLRVGQPFAHGIKRRRKQFARASCGIRGAHLSKPAKRLGPA